MTDESGRRYGKLSRSLYSTFFKIDKFISQTTAKSVLTAG
jgi:hypothetical protein